jgi:hypothetical protein
MRYAALVTTLLAAVGGALFVGGSPVAVAVPCGNCNIEIPAPPNDPQDCTGCNSDDLDEMTVPVPTAPAHPTEQQETVADNCSPRC